MSLISREDAIAHEFVGRMYSVLRLAALLDAIHRDGDTVTLTMSVAAYENLLADINAARMNKREPLEVPW